MPHGLKGKKIPVKFIRLGETRQDIKTFDPQRFVNALFGKPLALPWLLDGNPRLSSSALTRLGERASELFFS